MIRRALLVTAAAAVLLIPTPLHADSVAQVQTAIRISRETVSLIDPQTGRPVGTGTDTTAQPGDILSFIVQFTPVPNGSSRGLGGYVTIYVPRNTEVVGARIVDSSGDTVRPHRGGLDADGVGPRGPKDYSAWDYTPNPACTVDADCTGGFFCQGGDCVLEEGSLSQVYADTGIFFSTDSRTERIPLGDIAGEEFLTVFNGLEMVPRPTGSAQFNDLIGAVEPFHAHNTWDLIQAMAFGVNGGGLNTQGEGNTPFWYGSGVAGPESWYPYEASHDGTPGLPDTGTVAPLGNVGPWARIRTMGGEIGTFGNAAPVPDPGLADRVGIPAMDASGILFGHDLNADNALPACDYQGTPTDPCTQPWTNAVRYAVGELVVGEEYFAEISLRVLETPLDPNVGKDVVCAEVFGGDASAEQMDGDKGGKDNTWRYFLPAPSCVLLNTQFELEVDKLLALPGDALVFTIHGKNLSTQTMTNVQVTDCFVAGDVNFVSATTDVGWSAIPTVDTAGTGCPLPAIEDSLTWTIAQLLPGAEYNFIVNMTVAGGAASTLNRAVYTADQLPAPGFTALAFTNIEALTVLNIGATVAPTTVNPPPGTVTYTVTVTNNGTGDAAATGCNAPGCAINVTLPAGWSVANGTTSINGNGEADPAAAGNVWSFTGGLVDIVPAGGILILEFDVDVPGGTTTGAYTIDVDTWFDDTGAGNTVVDSKRGLAEVLVGNIVRSDAPQVGAPIFSGATTVDGTTTEAAGTEILVFVNGNPAATTLSVGGNPGLWTATVPTLFGGQQVTATATASGELESLPSAPVNVTGTGGVGVVTDCNDGVDNDGDGLTDFPSDPGCDSAMDIDETDPPECADGLDNDGDGLVDYPEDPDCSSFTDDTEDGAGPACSDGVDNDGDGLTDFPSDPGCDSAADVSEVDFPQCADGLDNDGDGLVDYPEDPECGSADDNDESFLAACADGADNDGDGLIDWPDDPGCHTSSDDDEADVPACSDGLDNDGDGQIDLDDPGCAGADDDSELDSPDGGLSDGGITGDASVSGDGGTTSTPRGGCCSTAGNSDPAENRGTYLLTFLILGFLSWRRRQPRRQPRL